MNLSDTKFKLNSVPLDQGITKFKFNNTVSSATLDIIQHLNGEPLAVGQQVIFTYGNFSGKSPYTIASFGTYTTTAKTGTITLSRSVGAAATGGTGYAGGIPGITVSSTAGANQNPTIASSTHQPINDTTKMFVPDLAGYTLYFTGSFNAKNYYRPRNALQSDAYNFTVMSFIHDGTQFEISCRGNDRWTILVDGKLAHINYQLAGGTGQDTNYLKVVFPVQATRRIVLIGKSFGTSGIHINTTTDSISPYNFTSTIPLCALMSDSYGHGLTHYCVGGGYVKAMLDMGVYPVFVSDAGGSGYVTVGAGGAKFVDRLAPLIDANPSIVITAGGYNDTDDATLNDQIAAYYSSLFGTSGLPNAKHIVHGQCTPPAHPLASARSKNTRILTVLRTYPNIQWIFIDPATGTWEKNDGGTGRIGNNPWLTSINTLYYVAYSDNVHPSIPNGSNLIGDMISNAVITAGF